MRVGIVDHQPGLSAYVAEILRTWGLAFCDRVDPGALAGLDPAATPVLVCPSTGGSASHEPLLDYARRGGTLIVFLPEGPVAAAAGLTQAGDKETPLRLRVTDAPASGLCGELLPIVGRAVDYTVSDTVRVRAYLSIPERYDGESVGICEATCGSGRIVAFAFDLPLSVLISRQGDPARSEVLPSCDPCARPSHLAAEFGALDCGWSPFADLLARLLADTVRACMPCPVPLFSHLPAGAPGILLYSGDEDGADVAWNDEELAAVARSGGSMNLYIIPNATTSTPADVRRYIAQHDVGPHPDLRSLDGAPVGERIREYERQILMFTELFGVKARSVRNHGTAWAGYLEPIEVQEKAGIRMDGNYFSGNYARRRDASPYGAFGGAMPMRFCRPDGRLLDVFQQHTQVSDDVYFHPTVDYSYKFSPGQFDAMLGRIFSDVTTRFHTPFAVCIHPSNWVKFSRRQGMSLLREAGDRGLPVWSFDRWLAFWEARDAWEFESVAWDGCTLAVRACGGAARSDLCMLLPASFGGTSLGSLTVDDEPTAGTETTHCSTRFRAIPLPAGAENVAVCGTWE